VSKRPPSANGPQHSETQQPKLAQYLIHLPFLPYSRFPAELASILLLAFSQITLVAALSQCFRSESPYLSIKLYRIYKYVYSRISRNIKRSILSTVSLNRSRSWNVLPVDTGHTHTHTYIYIVRNFTDLGARRGWVVSATPRPLYPRERPGTHCTGGWVGPRAGLDVYEKSRPHRDTISGPSSP
jgi:hypothetical protein